MIEWLLINYVSHIYGKRHRKDKGNCIVVIKTKSVCEVKATGNKLGVEKEVTAVKKRL